MDRFASRLDSTTASSWWARSAARNVRAANIKANRIRIRKLKDNPQIRARRARGKDVPHSERSGWNDPASPLRRRSANAEVDGSCPYVWETIPWTEPSAFPSEIFLD